MSILFALLFFLSIVLFLIGMFVPKAFKFILGQQSNRTRVFLLSSLIGLISIIGIGIFEEPITNGQENQITINNVQKSKKKFQGLKITKDQYLDEITRLNTDFKFEEGECHFPGAV